jgi:RNA polymerase primary sigma factor
VLPSDETTPEQIEDIMAMLNEMGINVVESEEETDEPRRRSTAEDDTNRSRRDVMIEGRRQV